jgi:hypothetical protein
MVMPQQLRSGYRTNADKHAASHPASSHKIIRICRCASKLDIRRFLEHEQFS